ncbi:hypothetical protein CJ030_MR5G009638 [Morella rubra]|uniref:Uncharacterized protein n=1 Tax=Morella rubra TaxID=262757 RepID=A0A6A1VMU9_9ROSI|nr:hypothetical protein CJ030_MR5G009638 [Morella rubra]
MYMSKKLGLRKIIKTIEILLGFFWIWMMKRMSLHIFRPKTLKLSLRLLHLISTYNFLPRGGHRGVVTFMDVYMLEHLVNYRPINLPFIMLEHIVFAREHNRVLPYGLIFTKIFNHHGIRMDMREVDAPPQSDAFNFQTLTKIGYKKNLRGKWVPKVDSGKDNHGDQGDGDEGDSDGDEGVEVPPHSSTTHEQSSSSNTTWQDSVESCIESLELGQGQIIDNTKNLQDSINKL